MKTGSAESAPKNGTGFETLVKRVESERLNYVKTIPNIHDATRRNLMVYLQKSTPYPSGLGDSMIQRAL